MDYHGGLPIPGSRMLKFAANLSTLFNELGFLDRFAAARGAGFDAVEFLFPYAFEPEQIVRRLERHDLQLVLHNLPPGNWSEGDRGIACDPRRVGEFQDSVELAIEYARELDVKRLHCMAGILPARVPPERARAVFIDNLRFASAALAPHGIDLLIEPINDRDMPGYFLTHSGGHRGTGPGTGPGCNSTSTTARPPRATSPGASRH